MSNITSIDASFEKLNKHLLRHNMTINLHGYWPYEVFRINPESGEHLEENSFVEYFASLDSIRQWLNGIEYALNFPERFPEIGEETR